MIMKSVIAATALAAIFAVAAPAEAKTHIFVGVGSPGYPGYYDPAFDYPPPPPPPRRWRHPRPAYFEPDYPDYGVSCGEGRQIVRDAGFRHVSVIECDGQNYKYSAERRGRSYVVKLDSDTGDIIGASRY